MLLLINDLFRAEKQIADSSLSKEERLRHRMQYCQSILDAYWKTVEENAGGNTTGKLNKAVNYSMNHKAKLMKFMENGDMEISNNAVENLIRNLVGGRKSWLFCDTEEGAGAIDILYSIIVTAHANGLNVRMYFEHVIRTLSRAVNGITPLKDETPRDMTKSLLPWAEETQSLFLAPDPFEGMNISATK